MLPSHVAEFLAIVENAKSGFAARTYRVSKPNEEAYTVIAYRGTNFFQWRDWFHGNLFDAQYRQGLSHFLSIRSQVPAGTRIVVVGHSLGGAIATYVSLRAENAPAYIFNSSPRLTRGPAIANPRVAVSQYGEVLVALRKPFINAGGVYTTINCTNGGPFSRHTQRYLADCLTHIAAWEDPNALASLEVNAMSPRRRVFDATAGN